jgi:hypothetical protein
MSMEKKKKAVSLEAPSMSGDIRVESGQQVSGKGLLSVTSPSIAELFKNTEMNEEPEQEEEEQVEERETPDKGDEKPFDIYDYIESVGGPSKQDVEDYKARQGNLYALPINENEVYLYRPLKRNEWNQLQTMFAKAANLSEDARQEKIVLTCLVWPRLSEEDLQNDDAGVLPSLYEAIMYSSKFMPTQMIINLVSRL